MAKTIRREKPDDFKEKKRTRLQGEERRLNRKMGKDDTKKTANLKEGGELEEYQLTYDKKAIRNDALKGPCSCSGVEMPDQGSTRGGLEQKGGAGGKSGKQALKESQAEKKQLDPARAGKSGGGEGVAKKVVKLLHKKRGERRDWGESTTSRGKEVAPQEKTRKVEEKRRGGEKTNRTGEKLRFQGAVLPIVRRRGEDKNVWGGKKKDLNEEGERWGIAWASKRKNAREGKKTIKLWKNHKEKIHKRPMHRRGGERKKRLGFAVT